jgi:RNA polymerase sigma-54 factor
MIKLTQQMKLLQTLTPQQILLSTLLQIPTMNLEQKIKTEMELNPVLEETAELEEIQEDEEEIDENQEEMEEIQEEFDQLEENNKTEEEEKFDELDAETNWEELVNDEDNYEFRLPRDKQENEYEQPEVYHRSMAEYLIEQLHLQNLKENYFRIGEYIIYNVRDDGYLDAEVTVETIATIFECKPEDVEKVLKQIQKFDPVGIASRNLQECLKIQLECMDPSETRDLSMRMIDEAFHDFVNKRYEKVANILDVSVEAIKKSLDIINKLNPKPGEGYLDSRQNYIIPDFTVEKVDDELVVSLNEWNTPGLQISAHYKKLIRQSKKLDRDVRSFLKKKVDSARWFLNALQQRRVTMLKTMNALVDLQKGFFENGPEYIKPLIMKDVAEVIEMDISTVSRVVNGKYVQTDYGVFELKFFFNEGMETITGENMSTLKIKDQLQEIIDSENPQSPFSDDKLADLLKQKGIPIARRTVAKYREQLDIPIARLRRSI